MPLSRRALSITPMLPSPPSAMGRRRICGIVLPASLHPSVIPSRTASEACTAVIEPLNLSVAITILPKPLIIFIFVFQI